MSLLKLGESLVDGSHKSRMGSDKKSASPPVITQTGKQMKEGQ